ncbi:MAG TPA: hydrogenase [Campylobacterales bacterium]|nr:hydrogenase [Campylobacterales bacterium]
MFNLFKNQFLFDEPPKVSEPFSKALLEETRRLVVKKFASKLRIYLLDSGSCNGCELELQLLFSPYFDIASLGIEIVYEVSEADILMITGVMTQNISKEIGLLTEQFKQKKNVILMGNCPVGKAPFRNNFALLDRGEHLFPLAYYIEGCPPEPVEILKGIHQFLKNDD